MQDTGRQATTGGLIKTTILGVAIDQLTFDGALQQIEGFITQRGPHQVVTVNADFVMLAQKDQVFRRVLNHADLAVADGSGLLWASRILDWHSRSARKAHKSPPHKLAERVTGADLVPALAARARHAGWKIYLLGGKPGVAARAGDALTKVFKGLPVVGAESGPLVGPNGRALRHDQEPLLHATLDRIKNAKPDILLVAFGAPKQDRFIANYAKELNVPVMIGVGGTFDFLAGDASRAPQFMQILWLEWLWRLVTEPWRFSRIIRSVVLFPLVFLWSLARR